MSRTLLVTQSTRSIGEFRRPWVRAVYRRYVERYRRHVVRAVRKLARDGDVTLLTARELADTSGFPPGVSVRYYDEESFRVDSELLAELTRSLASGWWPSVEREPVLRYRGVWLPELLTLARGIVIRLEITEPLGIARQVLDEVKPARVALLSGASMLERLARLLAEERNLPVDVLAPAFVGARAYARAIAALHPREERIRFREFLSFPRRSAGVCSAAASPRIVFVTCRPRHHFVVDPLAAAVRSAGAEAHVIGTPSGDPELRPKLEGLERDGIPWAYLTDYLSDAETKRLVVRYGHVFRDLWRRVERDPELGERLRWQGLPLARVVRPFLRDSVRRTLLLALLFQEAAFRALDALAPSALVVTSNRRYAERALALAARERGIPCLLFSGTLLVARDKHRLFDVADRLLVIGQHLKERLVTEQDAPPERICVIGDPRSNAARLIPRERLRAEVFRDLGLALGRPLLVIVSKYVSLLFSTSEKEAFYRTVIATLGRLPAAHVVIKVHPNEDFTLLRRQVGEWGWPDAILTKDYDIHRLFRVADAAIMVTSMGGLEAMALGCPVVAVQVPGKDYEGEHMPPYVTEGVVERVDMGDPIALADTLRRLLTDAGHRAALIERGRKFAARYVHPVDGALGERLLAVVEEVRRELDAGEPR